MGKQENAGKSGLLLALLLSVVGPAAGQAETLTFGILAKPAPAASAPALRTSFQGWMNGEVAQAWGQGYYGQNTTIRFVDDFLSSSRFAGSASGVGEVQRHGEWVMEMAALVAPGALTTAQDFTAGTAITPVKGQLTTVNLSYAVRAWSGNTQIGWVAQEKSVIDLASKGKAVVVKAAGNDGIAIGAPAADGLADFLNIALIGTRSAIFVGALEGNGTVANPVARASYSNIAGTSTVVQSQFLMVGVDSAEMGLAGTSFAAPVVSAYSAILGSKFTKATPSQITNRLLGTARTDTIIGYNPIEYGRGEASLARAMAPVRIK